MKKIELEAFKLIGIALEKRHLMKMGKPVLIAETYGKSLKKEIMQIKFLVN